MANTSSTSATSTAKADGPAKAAAKRVGMSRAVLSGRLIFLAGLLVVAGVLGFLARFILAQSETSLAVSQFEAIADRAISGALDSTSRKRMGIVSMASVVGNMQPNASEWPFVTMPNYEEVASNIIQASAGRQMGFAPLVSDDQMKRFEDFAYDFYENRRVPVFPNGTGVSSFGKGIWGVDRSLIEVPDYRYHVTNASTAYGSPYELVAPVVQHNDGPSGMLLLNFRYQEDRGKATDSVIECSERRALLLAQNESAEVVCGSVTDMLRLVTQSDPDASPGSVMVQPIYPANDKTVLTGFILSIIDWQEVLEEQFTDGVYGVDCVIETGTQFHTYTVFGGDVKYRGQGDLHEREYDALGQPCMLIDPEIVSDNSTTFQIHIYPSRAFFGVYSTRNPDIACGGVIALIVLTSILFILYDFFVRREFTAKKELLDAKRKFVRFVSHEVRTPLNSVCMGLTLMRDEMESALGHKRLGEPCTEDFDDSDGSCDFFISPHEHESSTKPGIAREQVSDWSSLSQEISVSAQSAVGVLNDLLNYDKIEMGTLRLELAIIPIWVLIERTALEFKVPAMKKAVNLKVDFCELATLEEGPPLSVAALSAEIQDRMAIGDTSRISQVLRNLVSNALKFTPADGEIVVRVSCVHDKLEDGNSSSFLLNNGEEVDVEKACDLQLSVIDSGAGMSPEQVEKVFGAGVQFNVNELQAGQGSGLGLYIAKGIMEQHGGTLTVASEGLGKGCAFTMTMPLYNIPEVQARQPSSESTALESGGESSDDQDGPRGFRILVVDDSATNRKLLSRLLRNQGHTCDQAEDGQLAVDHVADCVKKGIRYHTILLDYEMPVMNGPAASRELRRLGCDSFIVGITGNVLPEDVDHFKQRGASAVLPKPFKLSRLEEVWVEFGVKR